MPVTSRIIINGQCYGSGMFIPDPDFSSILNPESQIPDSTTATKGERKKNCCPSFFCCHKYQKIETYFIFEKEKN
jgi:hypothetical protein